MSTHMYMYVYIYPSVSLQIVSAIGYVSVHIIITDCNYILRLIRFHD